MNREASGLAEADPLELERLGYGMVGLTPAAGRFLAEAATVCFLEEGHSCGVELPVAGHFKRVFSVFWRTPDSRANATHADRDEATENGACGVAISLVRELVGHEVLERSWKATGFDYWIGTPAKKRTLFQGRARLEVSGTRSKDDSIFKARVRQKTIQTKKSDEMGLPAFVVVVDFGTPRSHVERR